MKDSTCCNEVRDIVPPWNLLPTRRHKQSPPLSFLCRQAVNLLISERQRAAPKPTCRSRHIISACASKASLTSPPNSSGRRLLAHSSWDSLITSWCWRFRLAPALVSPPPPPPLPLHLVPPPQGSARSGFIIGKEKEGGGDERRGQESMKGRERVSETEVRLE